MDIDMHYYGTYALARAAGFRADAARIVATAAQFVDDANDSTVVVHPQGARFRGEVTSHHPFSLDGLVMNIDADDQQLVWVPFHFLPGGQGATQSQKLMCTKNSPAAQAMVERNLGLAEDKAYFLELIGITAHVYADTFAHYGFSGVSSRVNRVKDGSIVTDNGAPGVMERFLAKFGVQDKFANFRNALNIVSTHVAQDTTGALGHGAVATFPDQPFLNWRYEYAMPDIAGRQDAVVRRNAEDYEEAAAALYGMFRKAAAARPIFTDGAGVEFDAIRPRVREILGTVAPTDGRIQLWKTTMGSGLFTSGRGEAIADYDPQDWRRQTAALKDQASPQDATAMPAYRFHQAASMHRNYVLTELLPRLGLYII